MDGELVDKLIRARLDKPFENVEAISNWLHDIEDLYDGLLSESDYSTLLKYGLDNIEG